MDKNRLKQTKFSIWYIAIAFVVVWIFQDVVLEPLMTKQQEVPYSEFRDDLAQGLIAEVTISDRITFTLKEESEEGPVVLNALPVEDPDLVEDLIAQDVEFKAEPPSGGFLTGLLGWILPLLPLVFIWWWMMRRMGKGAGNMLSVGKSKAQEISGEMTNVTFADVGGVDEVEVELKEVIDFLRTPEAFTRLGAKLPKGVLLVGPPGTGKTLLAKATAGEAGVPFFSISGSEFVEMFVGVGASRVRDMFEQAKAKAPCIVFIDEIDAVGRSRASGMQIQTNDEREQTLNQLLSEMDGFEPNQGVVIMGATNRPEVLDKALLRAGRFDRQIEVPLPTVTGRLQILGIHSREVPLAADVDLERLAKITPGFSGADLANIVNESALLATRRGGDSVAKQDFELAIERLVAGLQRDTMLNEEVRRRVAYHEGGHALVSQLLPSTDQVHKVSIIPTSKGALGYTMELSSEDKFLMTEPELRDRLAVLLGGRAAELLIFDERSTGASNDLERATNLARRMVTEFGMSDSLGPIRYSAPAGTGYLGPQMGVRQISPETEKLIDQEMLGIVEGAEKQALDLLKVYSGALNEIAHVLIEREVIDGDEVTRIIAAHPPA
jgi:cell division protease FtsH